MDPNPQQLRILGLGGVHNASWNLTPSQTTKSVEHVSPLQPLHILLADAAAMYSLRNWEPPTPKSSLSVCKRYLGNALGLGCWNQESGKSIIFAFDTLAKIVCLSRSRLLDTLPPPI